MTDPLLEKLRSVLGPAYSFDRELGGGGMSRVFVARDQALGREVVVKVLSRELSADISAARFAREIQLVAKLQHPHIVPVLAAGAIDGLQYYTMPFVRGDSLRARLEREPIPVDEATRILFDMAEALAYAHQEGVVHRDIKPENVLLSSGGAIITDFGVAKAVTESASLAGPPGQVMLTEAGMNIGTPAYMSPEQSAGDVVDTRTDVYAWGVVAYEALAQVHPFAGKTSAQAMFAAHIAERPAALVTKQPGVSRELAALVMQCLEKEREKRPGSARELVVALGRLAGKESGAKERRARVRWFTVAAVGLAIVAGVTSLGYNRESRRRWAHAKAPQEIRILNDADEVDSAYSVALKALRILPHDTVVINAVNAVTRNISLVSAPAGALVYRQPMFTDLPNFWVLVGTTPLKNARVPRGGFRVKLELNGYRPYLVGRFGIPDTVRLRPLNADRVGEFVPVRGGEPDLPSAMEHLEGREVGPFTIGRFEVTNAEFKRFIVAGGYGRRALWDHELRRAGSLVPWQDAMQSFVDRTKRPGPSTWELGGFPAGEDEFPVGGVSWYEARAYARFAGKQLPTLYHWARAASLGGATANILLSNMEATGAAKVGKFRGMSAAGAFDMAGNVREWCVNAVGSDRLILGGAWDDPRYVFVEPSHLDPFDRSSGNGLRLASYSLEDDASPVLTGPVRQNTRDFSAERPVSDEVFVVYRRLYDYDPKPLEARIEHTDTTAESIRERISFTAAYGDGRMIAYLYRPVSSHAPLQTVIFFPNTTAIGRKTSLGDSGDDYSAGVVRSGRAFLSPIFKGTYERSDTLSSDYPNMTTAYRDYVIAWGKDLRRAVDYAVSRRDVDSTRLAFYGMSWGGDVAGIMMAIEPRLKTAILLSPGAYLQHSLPEVDGYNFLPRVNRPVLMVGGRFDTVSPLATSQVPMFRLLGTQDKKHTIVDGGHPVTNNAFFTEALPWLDKHFGVVR